MLLEELAASGILMLVLSSMLYSFNNAKSVVSNDGFDNFFCFH